jgi:hypothetical protein
VTTRSRQGTGFNPKVFVEMRQRSGVKLRKNHRAAVRAGSSLRPPVDTAASGCSASSTIVKAAGADRATWAAFADDGRFGVLGCPHLIRRIQPRPRSRPVNSTRPTANGAVPKKLLTVSPVSPKTLPFVRCCGRNPPETSATIRTPTRPMCRRVPSRVCYPKRRIWVCQTSARHRRPSQSL